MQQTLLTGHSALLLDQVPSELSAAGAKRGERFLQLVQQIDATNKQTNKQEANKCNSTYIVSALSSILLGIIY